MDIIHSVFRRKNYVPEVKMVWIPAQTGIAGIDLTDNLAKSAAKINTIGLNVKIAKNEFNCALRRNGKS